jgi:adenylate cyclase
MTADRIERKLSAILAADVAGYSRLMGADEEGTLASLNAHRRELLDPCIARHRGRIVKTTGDGLLAEFASVVDAVRCAVEVQTGMMKRNSGISDDGRLEFRIGINVGDIVEQDGDIFGDGVNIAARLESIAEPGGICVSERVQEDAAGKVGLTFEDIGEQALKNITRPIRAYRLRPEGARQQPSSPRPTQSLPERPALAVLPFQNMSGDPEQEYFADGVVEDVITALSRFKSFAVVARNSSFSYKGRSVDVRQVGNELGVRYVLEGSVRRSGSKLRIVAQLVDTATGAHLWAQNFDGAVDEVFDFQDRITESVAVVVEPHIQAAEIERFRLERPKSIAVYDLYLQALPSLLSQTPEGNKEAYVLLTRALELEPDNAVVLSHAAWALGERNVLGYPPIGPDDREKCTQFARRALDHAEGDAVVLSSSAMQLIHNTQGLRVGDGGDAIGCRGQSQQPVGRVEGGYRPLALRQHRRGARSFFACEPAQSARSDGALLAVGHRARAVDSRQLRRGA